MIFDLPSKVHKTIKTAAKLTFGAALVLSPLADACKGSIATSTIYFVPHIKDYCATASPCDDFKKAVRLQGSGTISSGKVYTYKNKTIDIGDCETALGAAGKCLIPYISVAADPAHYRMGDIIDMPAMRGKTINMPDGTTMIHPGYFIVHDTGGSIKGSNRFDFFTGSHGPHNSKNQFGFEGPSDMRMGEKTVCSERKTFTRIRNGRGSHATAMAAIASATQTKGSAGMTSSLRPRPRPLPAQGAQ